MRIKPRSLEIEDETGFEEYDLFRRKDFANRLTNLIKNIEEPTVFLLDAPWGDGKTTFLKQWAGELRGNSVPVVEFDAFARDYQADPFIALSAEVLAAAKKIKPLKNECAKFFKRATSLGKAFLPIVAQIAINKASAGLLSLEDAKKLGKTLTDDVSAVLEERLKAAEADTELLSSFREALEELAKGISSQPPAEGGSPLVLIVDELDRCRPSSAVELIEKIKHVFAVPGVHFVLAAHLPQLAKVFQNRYGLGSDEQALTYLEKFYDVRLRFPAPLRVTDTVTKRYIRYLWGELELLPMDPHKLTDVQEMLECIFQNRRVSLRTVEKIMTNIALYYAGSSSGFENPDFVAGICCIRHCDPALYDKIASSNVTWDDINRFFEFDSSSQEGISSTIKGWWRLIFDCLDEESVASGFSRHSLRYRGKAKDILSNIAAQIDNFYPSGA